MSENYKLYTDGSNKVFHNIAGYGGYIEKDGDIIAKFSEVIEDKQLNYKHELLGVKRGLEIALEMGIKNISCYTDEKNNAKLLSTRNAEILEKVIKNNIQRDILVLRDKFESFTIEYLPREKNSIADSLSRKEIHNKIKLKETENIIDVEKKYFLEKSLFTDSVDDKVKDLIVFVGSETNKINIYHVKNDSNNINFNLVKSVEHSNSSYKSLIKITAQAIEDYKKTNSVKELVFFYMLDTKSFNHVHSLLKGKAPVTHSVKNALKDLVNSFSDYEKVHYFRVKKVADYLIKNMEKKVIVEPFISTKENVLAAIKELGEDDYHVGKNPVIEQNKKIKENEDDSSYIANLQKHYLNKFLSIGMRKFSADSYDTDIGMILSREEKANIAKNEMKNIRENLKFKGIKLRS